MHEDSAFEDMERTYDACERSCGRKARHCRHAKGTSRSGTLLGGCQADSDWLASDEHAPHLLEGPIPLLLAAEAHKPVALGPPIHRICDHLHNHPARHAKSGGCLMVQLGKIAMALGPQQGCSLEHQTHAGTRLQASFCRDGASPAYC